MQWLPHCQVLRNAEKEPSITVGLLPRRSGLGQMDARNPRRWDRLESLSYVRLVFYNFGSGRGFDAIDVVEPGLLGRIAFA